MAKYTTTIKTLIDNKFDFGLNDYPIFDENYRDTLNKNILNHFYMNEIGFETAGLFKFYLNQKMNEIMPKYNEIYKAQKLIISNGGLTDNVNIKEVFDRKSDTKTNTTSISNSQSENELNNKNLYLDTPQGNTYKGSIDDTEYATSVTFDRNNSKNNIIDNSNSNGVANNLENYIKTITGNNGAKYNIDILNDLKNKFNNIDMLVISELDELFMQVY